MPTINYPGVNTNPYNLKVKQTPQSNPKYGMQFGQPGSEYEFQQENLYGRYKDITDFNSPFYAQYRKYLQSVMPKIGTNAMLAPLMAGNMDYGTAQKLGGMRVQEMQGQQNEAVNQGVQGFAMQAQQMANPLLGQMGNNYFSIMDYWEKQRQFNEEMEQRRSENKSGFWNQMLGLAGGAGMMFIPGMQGIGAATMAGSVYGGASGGGK